ncbi:MAG: SusF/SusE family outer membrane protein [Paludibacteraceae bacterium]|nr:SusF/SusE family outer membrane protein [Paludibacteraceae bacterium]
MKKSNFFMVLAIVMMAFTQSVWGEDVKSSHFFLIGSLSGDNWNSNQTNYPINSVYESGTSKYYISVSILEGETYYFALYNGNHRYAPKGDPKSEGGFGDNKTLDVSGLLTPTAVCVSQGNKTDAWYGSEIDNINVSNNFWKFTANYTGTLRICIDETPYDGKNDLEWYPYVWLERPDVSKNFYLIGDAISEFGKDFWNANNTYCLLENKNAEGKYYVNLYLKNGSSFALTHNGRRLAPTASSDVVLNTTYSGSVLNGQDNSWKYTGETGLVRLVFNVADSTFTLEPWQMYLIGAPAQVQDKIGTWDVKNTSTPLSTPYVNAEGNIEAGKFYREVLLDKWCYFAFSDGILRYAHNMDAQNKDISSSDAGQQGTYDSSKQENSWKFVDASGYVRVCIDYNNPKPYIWLEWLAPKEVYPIGNATTYGWTPNNSVALTRVEGEEEMVYSGTLNLTSGELKFLCQKDWGTHYGPDTTATVGGVAMDAVGEYNMVLYKNGTPDKKWNNTLSGDYIVTLNFTTGKLTVKSVGPGSSVEQTSVVNDNIVYDIMGRALGTSLENLPQGIYVRNGKKFVVAQ